MSISRPSSRGKSTTPSSRRRGSSGGEAVVASIAHGLQDVVRTIQRGQEEP